ASDLERTDGASGSGARSRAPAANRVSRHRHDADLDARANAENAERPLQDHDRLYAESRYARSRYDVPDLHRADQSRLPLGSRHGEEAAGIDRVAAVRDRLVRQFTVYLRQAQQQLV